MAGAVGLALVGATLIATSGAAVAKTSARAASKCSVITDDHWPSVVQGRFVRVQAGSPLTNGTGYSFTVAAHNVLARFIANCRASTPWS